MLQAQRSCQAHGAPKLVTSPGAMFCGPNKVCSRTDSQVVGWAPWVTGEVLEE